MVRRFDAEQRRINQQVRDHRREQAARQHHADLIRGPARSSPGMNVTA
jgi:hypothetical protein